MNYLLDTNVVSEWIKPRPNAGVIKWLAEADEDRVFVSVVTLAEVRYGIERMPTCARRDQLNVWLRTQLVERFEGRILPVNPSIADAWGQIIARTRAIGRTLDAMDGFLSATAKTHGMTIVNRNISHFSDLGHPIFNPWLD